MSRQVGAGVYCGKGLNRYSNVHIDDLVDLYLLVMEKAPGGSFFFAENGNNSFKEVAEMISAVLGFGGRTVSLPVEDVILQHGEAGRLGVASNSLVAPPMHGDSAGRRRHLLLPNTSKVSGDPTSAGSCFRSGG